MANEFKVKNGLIVIGDLTTSGTITINGALAATQSWVTSQAYLTSASLSGYATQSYVTSAISSLIDAAPAALDTLNELAAALGDDANFSTTITNSIASKLSLTGGTLTGALNGTSGTFSGAVSVGNLRASITNTIGWTGQGGFESITDGNFRLYNEGRNTYGNLTLGAATLSGTLTGTSATFNGDLTLSANSSYININRISTAADGLLVYKTGGSNRWLLGAWGNSNNTFYLYSYGVGGSVFSVDYSTGIATFSNNLITTNGIADPGYVRITNPEGGVSVGNSPITASIKIALPANGSFTNIMLSFTVHIYDYALGKTRTLKIAGYTYYNQDWYNMSVYQSGGELIGNVNVRFGVEGGRNCVWIGETSTYWSYPNVFVTDVQCGHSQTANLTSGWNISFVTTLGTVQNTLIAYTNITTKDIGGTTNYVSKFTGANTLGNSLIFDNGTSVGIGTSSPNEKLDVRGNIYIPQNNYIYFDNSGHYIRRGASDVEIQGYNGIQLKTNSTTRVYIDQTGNVGIGTTDPTSQMSGTFGIGIYNALYPAVGFKNSTTAWLWYGQDSTFRMWNVTTGDILTANTSGNIGIGTNSPSTKLDVNGVITATGGNSTNWNTAYSWGNHASAGYLTSYSETDTLASVTARGASTSTNITFNGNITANSSIIQGYGTILTGYNAGFQITVNATYSGGQTNTYTPQYAGGASAGMFVMKQRNGGEGIMDFYGKQSGTDGSTQAYSTFNHLMTMLPTGNVGIGNTNPSFKLHVEGDSYVNGVLRISNANPLYFNDYGGGWYMADSSWVRTYNAKSVWVGGGLLGGDGGLTIGYGGTGSPSGGAIIAGNVGVGTSSPGAKLHVAGNAWINRPSNKVDNASCTELPSRVEFNNAFAAGSTGYTVFTYPTSSVFRIYGDYDGNVGGVQPDLQLGLGYLTVKNSGGTIGNIGIGTTSPSYKLHVVGDLYVNGTNGAFTTDNSQSNLYFLNLTRSTTSLVTAGNVGIKVANPTATLSLGTSSYDNNPLAGLEYSQVTGGGRLDLKVQTWGTGSNYGLTTGLSVLTPGFDTADVRVGIGTTSPATPLHVTGGASGSGGWNRTATLAATYPGLIFNSNGTKWGGMAYDYSAAMRFWVNANNDDIFAGTLAMSILNNGNVGIGTSNPIYKLQVAGSAYVNGGTLFLDSSEYLRWGNSNQGIVGVNDSHVAIVSGGATRQTIYAEGRTYFPGLDLSISNVNGSHGSGTYFRGDGGHFVFGLSSGNTLYLNYGNSAGILRTFGTWYHESTQILSTSRVLTNVSGNISMFTNDAGYLTSVSDIWVNTTGDTMSGSLLFADVADNVRLQKGSSFLNLRDPWNNTHLSNGAGGGHYFDASHFYLRTTGGGTTWLYLDGSNLNVSVEQNNYSRVYFRYNADRYSQTWYNSTTGAYWWVTTDADKLGFHRNGDGDKFYFGNTGDFYSATNGWLSTALAAKQNASTAITTSNIASQSVSYANSAGEAGQVTNQSGQLLRYDNRTISPSETTAGYLQFGFTSWGNDNSSPYADYLHMRSYTDGSGGNDNLVMFLKSGIGMRIYQQTFGSATAYSSYVDVWTTANFTSTNVSNWNTAYGWGNHASASYATTSYVTTQINNLINGAPGVLDTLDELAAALGDDANFATTVTNSIAGKVSKAGDTMTGNINWDTQNTGLTWNMNTDGAYIKFFNTGDGDTNSRLEYSTSDNGDEYHRWVIAGVEKMNLKWGGLTVTDTIYASGGNSGNWNTAYGWGNHASAGYALNSSLANYLPLSGGVIGGGVTINGNLTVNGTITENSSLKLKENVETSEGNLEKVVNLRPVTYNKIGSQTTELGLIAEEVAEVYPEFVQYDENGEPIGVHYSRLTAALIGAVKELNEQLQELKRNK